MQKLTFFYKTNISLFKSHRLIGLIIMTFALLLIPLNFPNRSNHTHTFLNPLDQLFAPSPVQASEGLTITKSGPVGPIDVGGEITYKLTVINNTGANLVAPILVTDSVPLNTTCNDNAIGATNPDWLSDCTRYVALWTLPSGNFSNTTSVVLTYTVTVTDILPHGYEIINKDYAVRQLPNGSIAEGTGVVKTVINAPRWQIDKTISFPVSEFVIPGKEIEYTLTYLNNSFLPISGTFFVTDTIPAFTTLLTNSLAANATYSGVTAGEVVTWTISSSLGSQQDGDVTYRVQVVNPFSSMEKIISNSEYGIIGANIFEPALGRPVTITVETRPILSITVSLANRHLY